MSEAAPEALYDLNDKPNTRSRFSWVKRLVQGQNRNTPASMRAPPSQHPSDQVYTHKYGHVKRPCDFSDEESASVQSDNVSTTPLKSVISHTSTTNPPSLLSGDGVHESSSGVASTAETSLAPSGHLSLTPSTPGHLRADRERDRESTRDSESIVTLASSSRRARRRSLDDNCSMAGIAPASIMERLSVHAAAAHQDTESNDWSTGQIPATAASADQNTTGDQPLRTTSQSRPPSTSHHN